MKALVIIMVLLLSVDPSYCRSWHRISRRIMKEQMKILSDKEKEWTAPTFFIKLHAKCRKKIDLFRRFDINKKDTLFILESHSDGSESSANAVIWTRKNQIYYETGGIPADLTFFDTYEECYGENYDVEYQQELAERWDTATIRKESREHHFVESHCRCLTRVIFDGKRYRVDAIKYLDFSNFEIESQKMLEHYGEKIRRQKEEEKFEDK